MLYLFKAWLIKAFNIKTFLHSCHQLVIYPKFMTFVAMFSTLHYQKKGTQEHKSCTSHVLLHSVFSLVLMALLSGCGGNPDNGGQKIGTETTPATTRNILFFGNSITAAYGIDPDAGFVAIVQKKIDEDGLKYRCINAGNSGETTTGGLARLDWLLKKPISMLVLELGGNDALRGIDPDLSRKNLLEIISTYQRINSGGKVLLLGMKAPPSMGLEYTEKFDAIYKEIAAKSGCALLPFILEGVAGDPQLNLPDGLHPNEEGQKILADNVWAALRPLLESSN
jgi:acyl-CoA thioesterase-1